MLSARCLFWPYAIRLLQVADYCLTLLRATFFSILQELGFRSPDLGCAYLNHPWLYFITELFAWCICWIINSLYVELLAGRLEAYLDTSTKTTSNLLPLTDQNVLLSCGQPLSLSFLPKQCLAILSLTLLGFYLKHLSDYNSFQILLPFSDLSGSTW